MKCYFHAFVNKTCKIKIEKISEVLTYQIHETKDQNAYDELTARISSNAKREGVEPVLRDILKSKGMLGSESWKPGNDSSSSSENNNTNK